MEERAFLKGILEEPDNDDRKLVYADWLEEHGDPRCEFLREVVRLRQQRVVNPEQRQQHQELSAELAALRTQAMREIETSGIESFQTESYRQRERQIEQLDKQLAELSRQLRQPISARIQQQAAALDPNWLAVVGDPEIEGCSKSTGDGWRLKFEFVCDKTWADIKPTTEETVRHCETCNKNVHFCDNLADAREHAEANHCIAVDIGIIRRNNDLAPPVSFLGEPSKDDLRKSYEDDIDVISRARLAARKKATKLTKKGRRC